MTLKTYGRTSEEGVEHFFEAFERIQRALGSEVEGHQFKQDQRRASVVRCL